MKRSSKLSRVKGGRDVNVLELTKAVGLARMKTWHLALRRLIEGADPATMTSFKAKSAEPYRVAAHREMPHCSLNSCSTLRLISLSHGIAHRASSAIEGQV
jgi:hypothetical protein